MEQNAAPKTHKFETPTVLVIFGVTGDLFKTKILISLFNLFSKGLLPEKFTIFGFSRRDWDDRKLRDYVQEIMSLEDFSDVSSDENVRTEFIERFFYVKGDFGEKDSYQKLAKLVGVLDGEWQYCSNKIYYYSTPPQYYETISKNLAESGLTKPCSNEEGWTRVVMEKPFGADQKSAKNLDSTLGMLFKEEQIYRVDHYLGKETVRNILALRFSNVFLEPSWSNENIDLIEVKLFERKGIEGRGAFFDPVGALRDVGQNHMLQLYALFTMAFPGDLTDKLISESRAEAISRLKILEKAEDVLANTKRGQFQGYLDEEGVSSDSRTETYFRIQTEIERGSLQGVPVVFESGKKMGQDLIQVNVTFKEPPNCLCNMATNPDGSQTKTKNRLCYTIKPDESIEFRFLLKKPGYDFEVEEKVFKFNYTNSEENRKKIFDYEQLLMDVFKGDQTLFVSTAEVMAQWEFIEPIVEIWKTGIPELEVY